MTDRTANPGAQTIIKNQWMHRRHLLELGESCEACEQYAAELIPFEEWARRTTRAT